MALQQTAWMRIIAEQLFKDNAVVEESLNWNEYVVDGMKTVVVPQAGAPAGYERNRSSFPATVSERDDTDVTYDMVDYTANPTRVRELDRIQLSYDKMASVVRMMLANKKEGIAEDIIYSWRPTLSGSTIKTTGASAASTLPGSTGNRSKITYADVVKAAEHLNRMNVSKQGRILLLPSGLHTQLLLDADVKDQYNQKLADYATGYMGMLVGFKVYDRSSALIVNASDAVKTPNPTISATDSEAGLYYQKDCVGRSYGNMQVFADDKPRPEHYGRIVSSEVQAGGRKFYSDGKGVGMIIPTTV